MRHYSCDALESVIEFLHADHSVIVMVEALHKGGLLLVSQMNVQ